VSAPAQAGDIEFTIDPSLSALGAEGYRLEIGADHIRLSAATSAGLYYATVTLRQLLPARIEASSVQTGPWQIPRLSIEDVPRFAWRGYSFDVARHFFGLDELKRQIEFAAYHKLNRFHLHLSDDQGFRIEIKSWPKLTEIGGSTQVGGGPSGFFTQEQYKELVAYAADRFVTIVPEIDMPGHTQAALASYAELNPDGKAKELYTGTKVGISTLWFDGEITYKFVDDVLREVSELTPGPYIHVGGDEAPGTDRTKYRAFVKAVDAIVKKYGKTLAGWCEVGEAELTKGSFVQDWRDDCIGSVNGAKNGMNVIVSSAKTAYLDMKYNDKMTIGHNWAGYVEVQKAYDWQPSVKNVADSAIAGVEAALWTEFIATRAHIDFMVFPRLAGHAEIAWSRAEGRSFAEYRTRLAQHGRRLTALGIGFYKSPQVDWVE
jgi:hexosaminidase